MGMYAHYWRITPRKWRVIKKDMAAADTFFGCDLLEKDDDDGWGVYMQSLESSGHYLDIQKAWHGLHFLLTGDADNGLGVASNPLSYVVGGGAEHQWEEDYGDVLFLTSAQARKASKALQTLSHEKLRPRLDAEKFNAAAIYPSDTWHPSEMEHLLDVYDNVAKFFHAAELAGDMILIQIS